MGGAHYWCEGLIIGVRGSLLVGSGKGSLLVGEDHYWLGGYCGSGSLLVGYGGRDCGRGSLLVGA